MLLFRVLSKHLKFVGSGISLLKILISFIISAIKKVKTGGFHRQPDLRRKREYLQDSNLSVNITYGMLLALSLSDI